jgi:FtsH-binding integral membrane protein
LRWSELLMNQLKESMGVIIIITILGCLLAAVSLFTAERFGVLKYVLLGCSMLHLTGCLSFTTTERTERTPAVSTVTRTETVYVTENGTRVRRVVTVDATGRRYYVDDGRTVYVDHYEY